MEQRNTCERVDGDEDEMMMKENEENHYVVHIEKKRTATMVGVVYIPQQIHAIFPPWLNDSDLGLPIYVT